MSNQAVLWLSEGNKSDKDEHFQAVQDEEPQESSPEVVH